MNSTFKPALLVMAGRMVAFATTFFIPVVLVRVFDQTEFGTYKQLFLVYATLFGILQFSTRRGVFLHLMNSTFKPALLVMAGRMVAFATTFFIPVVLVRVFDQTEFGTTGIKNV